MKEVCVVLEVAPGGHGHRFHSLSNTERGDDGLSQSL